MSEVAETTGGAIDGHQASTEGISLLDGETVLANEHPSWANWPKAIALGSVFVLAALGGIAGGDVGSFFGSIVVAGLVFGYVYLARNKSRYIVTDQRVKKNVGLLRNTTGETRIPDIRSLTTDQGLIERFLGKGTVQIDSTGAGGTLGISGVSDHEELAHLIREQQQKHED